ncbi:phosphoserine phosphatase SerB [Psychrobacter sp. I-STPA10]|uniref:phosphoserine phosphatase SerB n=1 Tax=Psychrobacter sp. I-STPA10 TaxID=2585769 RepID=UPI001E5C6C5A|nr:phosphoserine phosphatase SerB [Psychrobacter sp. I-STPA10]
MSDAINIKNATATTPANNHKAYGATQQLPHLHCWQNAILQAKDLLPTLSEDISEGNNDTLIAKIDPLPIFALIVVAQTQSLQAHDTKVSLDEHIATWAQSQPAWRVIQVLAAKTKPDSRLADDITDVQIYRYVLLPNSTDAITPEKKNAAAHILDDQLTAHLRQFIATLPITEDMGGDAAIDCHIVSLSQMLRPHRLACFDMDSTLIKQEVIVELAKKAGIGEQVNEITESAMRGEINFDESFSQRVALLEGLPTSVLSEIQDSLTPSAGAKTTLTTLKALGYHTVLLSGGFTYFAKHIAATLGIDEVHANDLDIAEGMVTGSVSLPIINGERKAQLVEKIAKHHGIDSKEIICVGDGANDLPMMANADLGVAFHAKPIVRARADAAINATGLEGVLYILGYDQSIFATTEA